MRTSFRFMPVAGLAMVLPLLIAASPPPTTLAQSAPEIDAFHRPLDEILDIQVRDGYVYYAALKAQRGTLDRYVASLDGPAARLYAGWTKQQQLAFWLNAYNAIVLRTVVNHYPIRGRAAGYPSDSIRQIPGAFDRTTHRVAGRTLTLDQIEKEVLPPFRDPRAYLALGRGAAGSGRLRSEAYSGSMLESQLEKVTKEFVRLGHLFRADRVAGTLSLTPIVGWHEQEFISAYNLPDSSEFAMRSPTEKAVLAFVLPNLLPGEREFVQRNQFKLVYHDFDWRLNDLTGGRR
jgi:hypothetical protein